MALLRYKDVLKMSDKDRSLKIKDLKIELIKANVSANKTNAKTKELKRALARLITFNKSHKRELNKENKHG